MTAVAQASLVRDAADVQSAVRDAAAAREGVRVVGAGTWLDAGRPVSAARTLSVAVLSGIVDYVPGDFTLTARAGTPLGEVARAAAAARQFLALDPFGSSAGTLGATVATGSAGPLAHAFGAPRDNVLGLEAVLGTGAVVRPGGRVVKNVAGFDLTRLLVGSWGTLGVLTEVTVRMRALPEVDESYALAASEAPDELAELLRTLRAASVAPWAMELVNAPLAERLGAGGSTAVLVRLAGSPESVRGQREALGRVGPVARVPNDSWDALRGCEPAGAAVLRLSRLPSQLAAVWELARAAVAHIPGALVHATPSRGAVRCIIPDVDAEALERLHEGLGFFGGSMVVERAGDRLRLGSLADVMAARPGARSSTAASERLTAGVQRLRLSRRIKDVYDPMHILNPGILGEAIA